MSGHTRTALEYIPLEGEVSAVTDAEVPKENWQPPHGIAGAGWFDSINISEAHRSPGNTTISSGYHSTRQKPVHNVISGTAVTEFVSAEWEL